jgi:hypothetical protein
MRFLTTFLCILFILFSACKNDGVKKNETIHPNDSASRAMQRAHNDSLKQKNPLLILPPDSVYTGDYVDKYPNGITKFRGQFRFGERHGQWMSFFPNGEVWSEMHYDRGLRNGPNIVYYENGKIRYAGNYLNDKQDSIWTFYDENGTMAKRAVYKNDRIVKELPLNISKK